MPHYTDVDGSRWVIDCADDPVIPDTDAPEVGSAFQLGTSGWSRVEGERLRAGDDHGFPPTTSIDNELDARDFLE